MTVDKWGFRAHTTPAGVLEKSPPLSSFNLQLQIIIILVGYLLKAGVLAPPYMLLNVLLHPTIFFKLTTEPFFAPLHQSRQHFVIVERPAFYNSDPWIHSIVTCHENFGSGYGPFCDHEHFTDGKFCEIGFNTIFCKRVKYQILLANEGPKMQNTYSTFIFKHWPSHLTFNTIWNQVQRMKPSIKLVTTIQH